MLVDGPALLGLVRSRSAPEIILNSKRQLHSLLILCIRRHFNPVDNPADDRAVLNMDILPNSRQLAVLRISYPIVILVAFFVAFIAHSILIARSTTKNGTTPLGPGGKPLPKRLRSTMNNLRNAQRNVSRRMKLAFAWLAVGVLLTYVADGVIHIMHVLVAKSEKWWCGQAVVVC